MRRFSILLMYMCTGYWTWAQQDSILLESVQIQSSRLEVFASADRTTRIDSNQLALNDGNSIAMLLTKFAPLNIRAYGIGGLSTASIRGTGSNQTAVLWEGINLQSQMNGSLDLNLVPAFMVDDVTIQSGGGASMFGSGAMGGTILLGNQTPAFNRGLNLSLHEQVGSFGLQNHGLKLGFSSKKLSLGIRGFYRKADNDFSFYNDFTQSEETQENANIEQYGLLTELAYRANDHQLIQIKHWYQNNNTYIPKTASAGLPSQAVQQDAFHRGLIKWQQSFSNKLQLDYKLGLLDHILEYDDKINTHSHNHAQSVINEAQLRYDATQNIALELGVNHTYENSTADNYTDKVTRNRTAIFLSTHFLLWNKLDLNLLGRQSVIDGNAAPFLPTLGLNYHATNWLDIKAKAAKSYRIPTFNDLYWSGSSMGNPDLVPEEGVSLEAGYVLTTDQRFWRITYEGTAFYNNIQDWILWTPTGSVWSPENKEELWSYGIEQSLKLTAQFNDNQHVSLNANYQYVLSTLKQPTTFIPEIQTTYTPTHQGNLYVSYEWKKANIGINNTYTGKQYSDESNVEIRALDPYLLTDINCGYRFVLNRKHQLATSLQVKNIFDIDYEVRRAYYMPGINYQFNLVYKFN
ncbi:TonB-dependent receptor plug domain-containing protein [Reichenbachiella agariperforans]|uniref:TonB-dependent receptor plug domain-containing protein n=1 Tax=Reichenbachiella agariperforans TaxID=156994 RepID=UPI001C089C0C|nr:TonB-dependent receptor [Reichenbachiella agariperforans]MBU2916268.1 TonB-dependent receptor [Reichenbachiella agariperforans]